MTATIRGRIWRTPTHPAIHIPRATCWAYEIRDTGRLLVRDTAPTHADALARTCRHIRLAHETNQDTP